MKVMIKTFEQLKKTEDITEVTGGLIHENKGLRHKDGSFFNNKMKPLCGEEIEVKKKYDKRYPYSYITFFRYWDIAEWMINNMNRNGANL